VKRYPFGEYILDIPDDHKIGDVHAVDHLYDRAFSMFYRKIAQRRPNGVVVDIGANIGDTAAVILGACSENPVICLEGSREFLPYLRSNLRQLGPRVTIVDRYLRPSIAEPIPLRAVHDSGTGYLSEGGGHDATLDPSAFIEIDDLLHLASGLGPDVALVKTDTDGFDGYIVAELLERVDCPLFFECDPQLGLQNVASPWPGVFRDLAARGYSVIVFDNHGLPMLAAESGVDQLLTDLCGYLALQRAIHPVRLHYLDVWAFPPAWAPTYVSLRDTLRGDLLKPYRF
jgi:FkbM family methyltransferase